MTAPRDGDRVRVVVEGVYCSHVTTNGDAHIALAGAGRVYLDRDARVELTIEVLPPGDFPGAPGTVWASRDGAAFLVVTNGLGRMMLSDSRGVWHSPELIAEQCGPMRRVEIPAEDVARSDAPDGDGGGEA